MHYCIHILLMLFLCQLTRGIPVIIFRTALSQFMKREHRLVDAPGIPAAGVEVVPTMLGRRRTSSTAVSDTTVDAVKASDRESEGFWGGCDDDANVKVVVAMVDVLVVANRSRIHCTNSQGMQASPPFNLFKISFYQLNQKFHMMNIK